MLARIGRLLGFKKLTPIIGLLQAAGVTVPADAESGYAKGCIFHHTDGGVGSALYVNHGSYESSLFQPIEAVGSAQAFLDIPIGSAVEKDGTALAIWGDGSATEPGWNTGAEAGGVRWDPNGNPDPIKFSVPIPPDLDATKDVILHISGAKEGATSGDAINWTVEAFNNVVGALYDADSDFGGECGDFVNTTKLVQEHTLTLAAANIAASPAVLTLTIQPKDGELGTDDAMIFGMWLEYTRKALTA